MKNIWSGFGPAAIVKGEPIATIRSKRTIARNILVISRSKNTCGSIDHKLCSALERNAQLLRPGVVLISISCLHAHSVAGYSFRIAAINLESSASAQVVETDFQIRPLFRYFDLPHAL